MQAVPAIELYAHELGSPGVKLQSAWLGVYEKFAAGVNTPCPALLASHAVRFVGPTGSQTPSVGVNTPEGCQKVHARAASLGTSATYAQVVVVPGS
jgi:hypothetical protein